MKTFRDIALTSAIPVNEYDEYLQAIGILEKSLLNEGILDDIKGALKKKIDFIKAVVKASKYSLKEMLVLFRNTKVFAFFKKIGFSIAKLIALIKKGFQTFKKLEEIMVVYIRANGGVKWVEKNLEKLDEYLQSHPVIKKFAGVAVAGLLIYVWTQMSYSIDIEWSLSWEDIIRAVGGKFSIAELFAGEGGILMLTYLVVGLVTGGLPYPGTQTIQILSGVLYGIYKIVKPKGIKLSIPKI